MRRILLAGVLGLSVVSMFARADVPATQPASPATRPAQSDLVTVRKGTLPIILIAPHGGTQAIPNVPVRKNGQAAKFVTGGDARTAELCLGIADAIEKELGGRPYVVVARFQRRFVDANRGAKDAFESDGARVHWEAYHDAVRAACDEVAATWGRGVVLDIHGQKLTPDGIYRGTRNGLGVKSLLEERGVEAVIGPDSIFGALRARGYKTLPEPETDAIGQEVDYAGNYSIMTYGSHMQPKVDAIQMEFGRDLREVGRLDQTARDAGAAIAVFARKYLPAKPAEK